jgi:hypothetical protein
MKIFITILNHLIPRIRDMVFITIFIGALLIGPRMINGDLGRHLTNGKYISATLTVPTRDIFSFTKDNQPRPPYEWLAQLLIYSAYRFLNLDGVVLLTAIVLALTFLIVYIDTLHRCDRQTLASILTLWAAAASSLHWLTRPHIFSFLFLAIWILWLEKLRKGEYINIVLLPLLMLVWVNTHGGFIFGILAWLAYLAGWLFEYWQKSADLQVGKKLIIVGVTSLISTLVTPDLWQNWSGVIHNNSIFILSNTAETMPPNLILPGIMPFTILLIFTIVMLLRKFKQIPFSHIFLSLGFAVLSLAVARNIPLFVIVITPILAEYLGKNIHRISWLQNIDNHVILIEQNLKGDVWLLLIPILSIGVFSYYQFRMNHSFNQFSPQAFPVQAVNWITTHQLTGNMFNDFNWGGYLIYRLWPTERVFIDSQSDFYGEAFTRQYVDILDGTGDWNEKLKQYKVSWIIVMPNTGLAKAAKNSSSWMLVYEDPMAVIFVQK